MADINWIQTFATTAGAAGVALLAFFLATLHEKRKREASWNRIKKELINDLLDCYDKFQTILSLAQELVRTKQRKTGIRAFTTKFARKGMHSIAVHPQYSL
jgi:hypothetical protein